MQGRGNRMKARATWKYARIAPRKAREVVEILHVGEEHRSVEEYHPVRAGGLPGPGRRLRYELV